MIEMRSGACRSWLDLDFSPTLCAQLSERLVQRTAGRMGVILTLTYRHDDFEDPRDLYRKASEQRHIRRFIEELSAYIGQSLTGRWFCKMEFQAGGWVHWHMLVMGVARIDHADLTEMWGRGYVWIEKIRPKAVRYLCKYVAKNGDVPAFLFGERPRSVKIIRVSPGFWGSDDEPHKEVEKKIKQHHYPFYRCIGQAIEDAKKTTVVRAGKKYKKIQINSDQLYSFTKEMGLKFTPGVKNWMTFQDGDMTKITASVGEWLKWAGEAAQQPPALHLILLQIPPEIRKAKWLDPYFREIFDREIRYET